MKKRNQNERSKISHRGKGLNPVTDGTARKRSREIALVSGREEDEVADSDVEQARRELQGDEQLEPTTSPEERLPEGERWDPVPGTRGHKAPTVVPTDEQAVQEGLIEEGIADAEHDRELAAARERRRREEI